MLYSEIIAVCSQIHTKHINTLCGQNVGLLNVKPAVHIVTSVIKVLVVPGSRRLVRIITIAGISQSSNMFVFCNRQRSRDNIRMLIAQVSFLNNE